jgi:DNA-binding NarL/FixJ family response regulator
MNKDKVIRIIIVEDHPMVREGLASMINIQPDMKVIAEAGSGEKALELYKAHEPDLTIMDLRLPGMSGVETILEIRKDFPSARFIALTTYEADEDMYKAIKAGVQGYLLKGMHFEALLEAIRAVHSGLRRIPAEIAKRLELRVAGNELTPRELDVRRRP